MTYKKYYKEKNELIPAIIFAKNAPDNYTEITDKNELKVLIMGGYKKKTLDGLEYFQEVRADIF